ncbi:MAG TPA: low molecular weight phosphatase family protein [Patescibacteria group bacterium]|nr:low molecular weight phosphatase family protein [Patescibacteria group bacterium]
MENEAPAGRVRCRVLFICVGNSCRSQFAEALSRHLAADVIEPASAGLSPLGRIAEPTRTVAAELGLPLDGQASKGFSAADLDRADLIVNLTGMPGRAVFETETPVVDWNVDDPYGEEPAVYRRIAAEIEARVLHLAAELRPKRIPSAAG